MYRRSCRGEAPGASPAAPVASRARLGRLAACAILALAPTASAGKPFLSSPSHSLCRPASLTLFSCQLTSGAWASLCLRRAPGAWRIALIDGPNSRSVDLSDLAEWHGGFARGGKLAMQGKSGPASFTVFVTKGGDPDQSFGAIRVERGGTTVIRFCRFATVATPSTLHVGPNSPVSVWALAQDRYAAELDEMPPWPSDQSLPCAKQAVVDPMGICVRRRHVFHLLPSGRWKRI